MMKLESITNSCVLKYLISNKRVPDVETYICMIRDAMRQNHYDRVQRMLFQLRVRYGDEVVDWLVESRIQEVETA